MSAFEASVAKKKARATLRKAALGSGGDGGTQYETFNTPDGAIPGGRSHPPMRSHTFFVARQSTALSEVSASGSLSRDDTVRNGIGPPNP